jgi:predicted ester cyclase
MAHHFAAALALGAIDTVGRSRIGDATAIALTRPRELIVSSDVLASHRAALLKPVDAFYGLWVNGSSRLLAAALSPGFVDHTLPSGRPQGPAGPAAASKVFLAAVPDLRVVVVQRIVVGDRVVSHLRFTGHFTGIFQGVTGGGQPIDFIATDILKVRDGKITDNWHLEDNLTRVPRARPRWAAASSSARAISSRRSAFEMRATVSRYGARRMPRSRAPIDSALKCANSARCS